MNKFKAGDRVVCISIDELKNRREHIGDQNFTLELYKVYTVKRYSDHMNHFIMVVDNLHNIYTNDRFVTLSEFRKKKIESLYK